MVGAKGATREPTCRLKYREGLAVAVRLSVKYIQRISIMYRSECGHFTVDSGGTTESLRDPCSCVELVLTFSF